jgi:hypothetical protein
MKQRYLIMRFIIITTEEIVIKQVCLHMTAMYVKIISFA